MQIQLSRYIGDEANLIVAGLPEGSDAYIVTRAAQRAQKPFLFIARDDARAAAFSGACQFFAPDIAVINVPAWDSLPFDRTSPSRRISSERAGALFALSHLDPTIPIIIVSTIAGVLQRVPPANILREAGFHAKPGHVLSREKLENYLSGNGYARASTVMEAGDFAIRGGIVDVFSPALDMPIRLDFFGDELESIRSFDPETQRTTETLAEITLAPVSEIYLDDAQISTFRKNYIATFGGGIAQDPVYAAVSQGIRAQGIEPYLPLFYDKMQTVFDYIPDGALIGLDGLFNEAVAERRDVIADFYDARAARVEAQDTGSGDPAKVSGLVRPLPMSALYPEDSEIEACLERFLVRQHAVFRPDGQNILDFEAKAARNFSNERRTEGVNVFNAASEHIQTLTQAGQRVLVAAWSDGSGERLAGVFADHGQTLPRIASGASALQAPKGTAHHIILPIENGFTLGNLSILSEQDILGDRLVNRGRKRRAKNFIAEASAMAPGDLVIHIDHGLGRYLGLKTLDAGGAPHDCLELEYAGEARLYLPVENIELLSRYGAAGETVTLDKLGGVAWQSRKAKAKQRLKDMAAELIKIAAKRAMRTVEPIDSPDGLFEEFCARFPYVETDDQLHAIEDVLGDLSRGTPMDRLICGDVGFGKTEVALRAAFVIAMSGRQVAVVAPTTILSRQHYKTFSERFRGWPVKVRQLSRLVSSKDAKETKEDLANGRCEIVIGTHALLSKTVKFSDLGLLVVDEEQRFGVQHKERLKAMRGDTHVLTLTATPIPRTLQMALSGIRDLSLIATPPVDRLAVRTYVSPFDVVGLRKAILRERYRGGQTFFVVPRISDLPRIEEFLTNDVPEVSYVIAHGQMAGGALEDIMSAFYDGQYDVLISTSIIESGIDIPAANTMIVYRADRFGLAQLYQMRGRVGRSKVRAYAYLTIPGEHIISKSSLQRLRVLQSLDTLGSGFTLASHDLDLRGGGNPLGEEQSGYVKDVGVELYQHMLEEAVAELREDRDSTDQSWTPNVNAGVAVLIPESYIEDLNLRLAIYRRISELSSDDETDSLAAELIDRFGPLPSEVSSLLKVMQIKRLCRAAHVEKIDAGPKGIVLSMRHQDIKDPSVILNAITQNQGWRLRPDQTILIKGNFHNPEPRVKGMIRALKALLPETP